MLNFDTLPNNVQDESGIVEEKYMIVITRYPDGQRYEKIFKMGTKNIVKKKPKKQKKLPIMKVDEQEVI